MFSHALSQDKTNQEAELINAKGNKEMGMQECFRPVLYIKINVIFISENRLHS